jgi:hypothetical protein
VSKRLITDLANRWWNSNLVQFGTLKKRERFDQAQSWCGTERYGIYRHVGETTGADRFHSIWNSHPVARAPIPDKHNFIKIESEFPTMLPRPIWVLDFEHGTNEGLNPRDTNCQSVNFGHFTERTK